MEEFKIDAQRIIDIMSEEITGYVSKLAIAKAQIESLAKIIDAQNNEITELKAKVASTETATKKAGK